MKKIIFILLVVVIATACNQGREEVAALREEKALIEKQVVLLNQQVASLEKEVTCLKEKLVKNKLTPDCNPEPKTKIVYRTKYVRTPTPSATPAPTVTVPAPTPSATPAPILEEIRETRELPVSGIGLFASLADPDGVFRFCIRANGREDGYFPDWLVRAGEKVVGAADNGRQGHNLVVYQPTEGFENPEGGITTQGIIYYPAAKFERFGKISRGDFFFSKKWGIPSPAKKEGSWYIFNTQE